MRIPWYDQARALCFDLDTFSDESFQMYVVQQKELNIENEDHNDDT